MDTGYTKQEIYACWLDRIPLIGTVTIKKLLAECESPENIYRLSGEAIAGLMERKILTAAQAQSLHDWQTLPEHNPSALYDAMKRRGIRCVLFSQDGYPDRLREIIDPPSQLYVKGSLPGSGQPTVGIVGARLCSDYGRYTARRFGAALAQAGIQIISGMALGIDGISHKAALDAGGRTFAVLGCGVDICYPEENRGIYDRLNGASGILSEYPPGTAPHAGLFPQRNRIISGLSDLLLVVEARKKSGTLITVDQALEQGKEVYAVPGRVTDALSCGCNHLIRQGAGVAVSPEDLIEAVFELWDRRHQGACALPGAVAHNSMEADSHTLPGATVHNSMEVGSHALLGARMHAHKEPAAHADALLRAMSENERRVYALLTETGQTMDALLGTGTLPPGELSAALVRLCIAGLAVCEHGRYKKCVTVQPSHS